MAGVPSHSPLPPWEVINKKFAKAQSFCLQFGYTRLLFMHTVKTVTMASILPHQS